MLVAALVPLVVVAVLSYLVRQQQSAARRESAGESVLEYGRLWRWLAIGVGATWTVVFAVLFIYAPPKRDDIPAMLSLIGVATLTLVPYAVTVYGFSLRLTPVGFAKRSPWSRNFEVRWEDVRHVSFNGAMQQLVLETRAGKARVSGLVDGLGDLRDALEVHVPAESWSGAKEFLSTVSK